MPPKTAEWKEINNMLKLIVRILEDKFLFSYHHKKTTACLYFFKLGLFNLLKNKETEWIYSTRETNREQNEFLYED